MRASRADATRTRPRAAIEKGRPGRECCTRARDDGRERKATRVKGSIEQGQVDRRGRTRRSRVATSNVCGRCDVGQASGRSTR